MKKCLVLILCTLLLLCSCHIGSSYTPSDKTSQTDEETSDEVTADAGILFSAGGFDTVYDDDLKATWVYLTGAKDGFYTRLLVYDTNKVTFRIVCTDASWLEYDGKTYEISDGDMPAEGELINVLSRIANGDPCRIGERDITEKEREDLDKTLRLFYSAYGALYTDYSRKDDVTEADTDENGNLLYECEKFSVKYPASYGAEYKNGELTIASGSNKPRTVVIRYSDTEFSSVLADEEAVRKNVSEQGGELISDIVKTTVGEKTAYGYKYETDGVYIIQYFVDGGNGTYIITGGTYDRSDIIPENIISTFKVK